MLVKDNRFQTGIPAKHFQLTRRFLNMRTCDDQPAVLILPLYANLRIQQRFFCLIRKDLAERRRGSKQECLFFQYGL